MYTLHTILILYVIKASKSQNPIPIPIRSQQKAVHWAERLTASTQGLTVNSCAWCTHAYIDMYMRGEREREKESQESHIVIAYVPWVSEPKYCLPLLPPLDGTVCFGLLRCIGSTCLWVIFVIVFISVSGYLCLPLRATRVEKYLLKWRFFWKLENFFANFSIHLVVKKWRWLVCHVSSILQSVA